jgi:hypothetical protein
MKKGLRGIAVRVHPHLAGERLRVVVTLKTDAGEVMEAQMPDREVSALLPRSILLGAGARAPVSLLGTVQPILARLTEGRQVRVWQYRERWFLSFPGWRGVRFVQEESEGGPPEGQPPQAAVEGPPG